MKQPTFGKRLAAARRIAGYRTQQSLGDVLGVAGRTVRNWETDSNTPDAGTKEMLHRLLGDFDIPGDAVEVAVRQSDLVEWRQDAVISKYKEHLHLQREEATG